MINLVGVVQRFIHQPWNSAPNPTRYPTPAVAQLEQRRSMDVDVAAAATSASNTRCCPMKPVPPVTSALVMNVAAVRPDVPR